jgi:hypothetical protein
VNSHDARALLGALDSVEFWERWRHENTFVPVLAIFDALAVELPAALRSAWDADVLQRRERTAPSWPGSYRMALRAANGVLIGMKPFRGDARQTSDPDSAISQIDRYRKVLRKLSNADAWAVLAYDVGSTAPPDLTPLEEALSLLGRMMAWLAPTKVKDSPRWNPASTELEQLLRNLLPPGLTEDLTQMEERDDR